MITQTTNDPPVLYGRLLDSIETYGMSRPTHNEKGKHESPDPKVLGLPDTWRINPGTKGKKPQGVQMTHDFQFWIYCINVEQQLGRRFGTDPAEFNDFYQKELAAWNSKNGGDTIKSFNSLFRTHGSHTNFAGVDKRNNYITGEMQGGDPIFSNVVTGRWVFEVISNGSQMAKVINAQTGFLQFNPWDNPELFDQPLITGREFQQGSNKISRDDIRQPYAEFKGKTVMPVILPVDDCAVFQDDAKYKIPSDNPSPLNKFASG